MPRPEERRRLRTAEAGWRSLPWDRTAIPERSRSWALKYYRPEYQCLSEWTADELRAFSAFCRKLAQMTWQQIVETGGRFRTGLGCTPVERGQLPGTDFLHAISDDISWMEMRVTQVARVFGFRAGHAFFLVFLDRTHDIIRV